MLMRALPLLAVAAIGLGIVILFLEDIDEWFRRARELDEGPGE